MVIIAWSPSGLLSSIFEADVFRNVSTIFITAAFLNFLQGKKLLWDSSAFCILFYFSYCIFWENLFLISTCMWSLYTIQCCSSACFKYNKISEFGLLNLFSHARDNSQLEGLEEPGVLTKDTMSPEICCSHCLVDNSSNNIHKLHSKSHRPCEVLQQLDPKCAEWINL